MIGIISAVLVYLLAGFGSVYLNAKFLNQNYGDDK